MLLNEEEAGKRLCPHFQSTFFNGLNGVPELQHDRCCASRCMAWRWGDEHERRKRRREFSLPTYTAATIEEAGLPPDGCATWEFIPAQFDDASGCVDWAYWLEPEENARNRRRGYCGLAGKPVSDE